MPTKNEQYLLDTNILIEFMSQNPIVVAKVLEAGLDACSMSIISLHELFFGAFNAKKKGDKFCQRELARIEKLISKIKVLPLKAKGDTYGDLKYSLMRKGQMIDEFDILIAEHAITESLTVVTDNLKHFERIPGLKVENWMER